MPRRIAVLLLSLPLGACGVEPLLGPAAMAGGASLVFTGRTPVDHAVGWWTGQDCSAVRLERHGPWCVTPPAPPGPAPVCTRSLATVDCWTGPPPGTPEAALAEWRR
jgi:hypothetical protein